MNSSEIVIFVATGILPGIFAITVHELAHGWVANKCGDQTAFMMGRITLNPFKHIDIVRTIIMPLFTYFFFNVFFAGAKPVPVAWHNLRHPRRDMALVAAAGPAANLLMAIGWGLIGKLASLVSPDASLVLSMVGHFFLLAGYLGVLINCILLIFNLIPIPPLDGSRIVSSILPAQAAQIYEKIESYGIFILIILVYVDFNFTHILLRSLHFLLFSILNTLGLQI
ncbi:MAG: site-2 protease family protein [Proteobacteria bacterium]|nr:site-2 protease family protein [Pseudomonadota bacterium]